MRRARGLPLNPKQRQPTQHVQSGTQDWIVDGYAPSQLVEDLRKYQAELEIQNKALRYSQQEAEGASERFATLFSNVPLALMVVDEEGLVMASNAMALRLFQPLESDPPLNFLLPFVLSEHADAVATAFLNARDAGTSEVHEVVFQSGSHSSFTGDLHIAKLDNTPDELAHFICAIIDQGPLLTQRQALQESAAILRQRNEDLLQSENRMAAVINSSLDAILCVDLQHRITVFNPAATALFACPEAAALGSPLSRFLPAVQSSLEAGEVTSQTVLGEFAARTLQGQAIQVEVSVALEPSGVTTLFARDLTARKQAEVQRAALEAQLRASQKMQAVGTMAGGIAHDFNNILSAILGNTDLARQDVAASSTAMTSLLEIDKAGRRARDLVRQILTFSRNEVPKRTAMPLGEVVQETVRLVRVTLPPHVELFTDIPDHSPQVLADSTQIEQALLNLCTNAVLSIGADKGSVHVTLAAVRLTSAEATPLGLAPGPFVSLSVSDTGSGMSEATLERIFEPFFTTREVGQGTGLGLAVVHGILQTHQGGISVQSTLGTGSTFTLYFPVSGDQSPASMPPTPANREVQGRGKHVMYVDDDQALVFLVRRVLQRRGFQVSTFTDPREAQHALEEDPQRYDLLVTDYNMPGFSGLDLLRAAKQLRPDLPVALASGYVTPEIEANAQQAGANAMVYKPNDVNELCETVQRLVHGPAT